MKTPVLKLELEAAILLELFTGVQQNRCSEKFRKIHGKPPSTQPFLVKFKIASLQLYQKGNFIASKFCSCDFF